MALITCPECGKQVSGAAGACPFCGYPIRDTAPKSVRIKLPDSLAGAEVGMIRRKNKATVYVGNDMVWCGPLGTTAVFELQNKGIAEIQMDYGNTISDAKGIVEPGRRYTVQFLRYKGLGILKMPVYGLFEE